MGVPKVVVDVMPKPEILDPQGKAVLGALPRLGFEGVTDVRQGKRFELQVAGDVTDEVLAQVHQMAETLLSNPVIEYYALRIEQDAPGVFEVPDWDREQIIAYIREASGMVTRVHKRVFKEEYGEDWW